MKKIYNIKQQLKRKKLSSLFQPSEHSAINPLAKRCIKCEQTLEYLAITYVLTYIHIYSLLCNRLENYTIQFNWHN